MADTTASQALFNSAKYSDLTVTCGSDVYNLHRAIVCPRSTWFDKEAKTATIDLKEDNPDAVNRMLIYLYTLDYPDGEVPKTQKPTRSNEALKPPHLRIPVRSAPSPQSDSTQATDPVNILMNNALVYALADKYDLSKLKIIARDKFLASTKDAQWPYKDFIEVIHTVYNTTPDNDNALRSIITGICVDHFSGIVEDVKLKEAIMGNSRLSFNIAQYQSVHNNLNRKALPVLRAELVKVKAELLQARKEVQDATSSKSLWNTKLEDFIVAAASIEQCRNCCEQFNGVFYRGGNREELTLQLRCIYCRCRHDIGAGIF
ncbi:hypothetical protein P7C71_g1801, partial [Lecanoromycetidae sp. Uapishka_2]